MPKVKTGVPGLDEILHGGVPGQNVVLLSGGPGSGKTILCSQFINYGVMSGEPGVYITMEEEPEQLILNMKAFGWDLGQPGVELSKITLYNFDTVKDTIQGLVEKIGAKRLVIDPITHLGLFFDRNIEVRRSLIDLVSLIKRMGVTAILTAEIPVGEKGVSTYKVEEFVTDGVIVLRDIKKEGSRSRAIEIVKMRGSGHERALSPFKITKKGIVIYPNQPVFK
jgi:KaiC/GvpD/RAD55 family RecA-like ATPase